MKRKVLIDDIMPDDMVYYAEIDPITWIYDYDCEKYGNVLKII